MFDILQWLTTILFGLVSVTAFNNLTLAHHAAKECPVARWISATNTLILLQATLYIYLQVEWIVGNHGEDVGGWTDTMWLLYDYFTGFALLCFAHTLGIYIKWQGRIHGKYGCRIDD